MGGLSFDSFTLLICCFSWFDLTLTWLLGLIGLGYCGFTLLMIVGCDYLGWVFVGFVGLFWFVWFFILLAFGCLLFG